MLGGLGEEAKLPIRVGGFLLPLTGRTVSREVGGYAGKADILDAAECGVAESAKEGAHGFR